MRVHSCAAFTYTNRQEAYSGQRLAVSRGAPRAYAGSRFTLRHSSTIQRGAMRLNKIKLAGFKSFVDPTAVNFPSNLIGVVGPNGCGKSNIIDAVRWVMGEISAKHLRGDSMADVV